MSFLFFFLGALVGSVVVGGSLDGDLYFGGAVIGGLLGWLFARDMGLRRDLREMNQRLTLVAGSAAAANLRAAQTEVRAPAPPPPSARPPGAAAPTPAAANLPESAGARPAESPIPARAAANASDIHAANLPETDVAEAGWDGESAALAQAEDPGLLPPQMAAAAAPAPPPPVVRAAAARAREPLPPHAAPQDDPLTRFGQWLRAWFTEGNVPVKVGMVLVIIGVGALLKYGVDQNWFRFPIELRLAVVAALGVAGLLFGWKQRESRPAFGLSLQGGAIGVLILTTFASYRLYGVIGQLPAFGLLIALVAAAGALAVLQDAMALAVLGLIAGFLAPILISSGDNNYIGLFSYYSVLNLAIFGVAWKKSWRPLNLLGFVFTFGIGLAWGVLRYEPENFATTEPFLILFFLLYVAIPLLYAWRQPEGQRGFVDGTLIFGTPLVAFMLQIGMLQPDRMPMAFSALIVGVLYALLAALNAKRVEGRNLRDTYAGLALGFVTLAIPLAFSAGTTSIVWAAEGGALVWLGLRQSHRLMRFSGLAMQAFAALAFMARSVTDLADLPLLNGYALGALLIAFAALLSGLSYCRARAESSRPIVLLIWGVLWWTIAGLHEIDRFVPQEHVAQMVLLWLGLSGALAAIARSALRWPHLAGPALLSIAMAPLMLLFWSGSYRSPFEDYGALAWLGYALAGLLVLRRLRDEPPALLSTAHVLWWLTWPALLSWQMDRWATVDLSLAQGWRFAFTLAPLLLAYVLLRRAAWVGAPLQDSFDGYKQRAEVPLLVVFGLALVLSLLFEGNASPLPFLPLANPLELIQVVLIVMLGRASDAIFDDGQRGLARKALLVTAFAALSAATLRATHVFGGLSWSIGILDQMLAQSALSIVWSIVGIAAMLIGSKRGSRTLWMGGAALMAIVVAKLGLIDRHHLGNLNGIVAFFGVGVLLVAVGYFSPAPPRETEQSA